MKKDRLIMYVSMFLNFVVAVIKLISGVVFNFSSLIADSLQSLFDFVTDIIVMLASKVGNKRATKRHPFGYGMVENISNLFIGIVLFGLALFILIRGFIGEKTIIKPEIFVILIITLFLKVLVVFILYGGGKKYSNNSLLVSAKESLVDLIATVIVLIVSLMLLFENDIVIFKYADVFGSIIISSIIFYTAVNVIKVNIDYLLGTNEENEDIKLKINNIINDYKIIKNNNFKLMRIGDYYTLYLTIELDNDITLHKIMLLENKIKKKIRNSIKDVKYIQIEFKEFK